MTRGLMLAMVAMSALSLASPVTGQAPPEGCGYCYDRPAEYGPGWVHGFSNDTGAIMSCSAEGGHPVGCGDSYLHPGMCASSHDPCDDPSEELVESLLMFAAGEESGALRLLLHAATHGSLSLGASVGSLIVRPCDGILRVASIPPALWHRMKVVMEAERSLVHPATPYGGRRAGGTAVALKIQW